MPMRHRKLPVIKLAKNQVAESMTNASLEIQMIHLRRFFYFSMSVPVFLTTLSATGADMPAEKICSVKIQSCMIKNRSPTVANMF